MTKFFKGDNIQSSTIYDGLNGTEKDYLRIALNRGATRRDVMQMMMAGGLTIAAAGSVVASASQALAATPKKGGSVTVATHIHGPNDTLDPALLTSPTDYSRGRAHYNGLVQLSDDLTPQPELASEFGPNSDATEWTFKLREDVEFHDGSKLTADDIIYSMNRHIGEKSVSVAKTLFSPVKEWVKVGSHEVKAICETPYADLAAVLSEKQFKVSKADETNFQNPLGTGPYKLEEFQPGVRSVHVRNDNYWREGAHLDSIEIFGITDTVARLNALLANDVQLASSIDPKAVDTIEARDGVEVISIPSGSILGICLMANLSPGNNPDFVRGMKLLQRREKVVRSLLRGHGTVGNDHYINAAYGADYCAEIPMREYDPEQAKHFLEKSGITSAEVQVAEVTGGITDLCLMWQQECRKIGFDLKVTKVPSDGYWGTVWQKAPINVTAWNMRPTATIMQDIALAPDAAWNDTYWKNDRMGELLKQVKAETDPATRHMMQCEMQQLTRDHSGMIIPAHRNTLDAKSSKVMGMPKLPLGFLGASEWPEFIWLDS